MAILWSRALPCEDGLMDETAFPPADLHAFLTLCVGSWMSLRSRFDLNGPEDDWHSSDRGEVTVSLDGQADDTVLSVQPADGAAVHSSMDAESGKLIHFLKKLFETSLEVTKHMITH